MAEVAVCPSLVARELLLRRAVPYFSVFSLSARGTSKVNLGERTVMYEDSWYSFVPELPSKKDDASSQSSKHNRRESLLRQANGSSQASGHVVPIMELLEGSSSLNGPPEATLARRAKSYSDFYHVARDLIGKEARKEKNSLREVFKVVEHNDYDLQFDFRYEEHEDNLLDASQEDYQLYRDQLALSERHLDNILDDTTSALDLLATLSDSFKAVESQTTAFQAQCEDLLAEQKRLRDLADEVGTDLQYYSYLEPLTRRLNAPGAARLVRNDDFVEMLTNLNACIDFMDKHPQYRDSTVYKTRYTSLLENALNLIFLAFSKELRDISDNAQKQLKMEISETTEYVLLFGAFENVFKNLGPQLEEMLTSTNSAFPPSRQQGEEEPRRQWHLLFGRILEEWITARQILPSRVRDHLSRFAESEPLPNTDFQSFSRRCTISVVDICHEELKLLRKVFGGALNVHSAYTVKLEDNAMSHVTTLFNFLKLHFGSGVLGKVCDLVSWLEMKYMSDENENIQDERRQIVEFLLSNHLWEFQDSLFYDAAINLQRFQPSAEDLKINSTVPASQNDHKFADPETLAGLGLSMAYPTVKIAANLLLMYNDSKYERPPKKNNDDASHRKDVLTKNDVLYEIIHQTTESLQRAATTIKRQSSTMDAQIFLIKNGLFLENLFRTHEIPESTKQIAELDFSPIWSTISQLQARRELFNPLAYYTPLLEGKLLPTVVDKVLDARKELERVLVQQITAFTKHWQSLINDKNRTKADKASADLTTLLEKFFDDYTTRTALLRMIEDS